MVDGKLLPHDELCQKIVDVFLVNGAVAIEGTEDENFQLAINDVVVMFEEMMKGVRDASRQTA